MIGRFLRSKITVGQAVVTAVFAVLGGFFLGYSGGTTDSLVDVMPLCHEDETILADGRCWPVDDAEYIGGHGWVTHDQWLWLVDTGSDS